MEIYTDFYDMVQDKPLYLQSGYTSIEEQTLCYQALLGCGVVPQFQSILDVGCGVGGLYFYMKESPSWRKTLANGNYCGIDSNIKAIELGKKRDSAAPLYHSTIEDFQVQPTVDWIILSSVFNYGMENPIQDMMALLKKAWNRAECGISFNCMMDKKITSSQVYRKDKFLWYFSPHLLLQILSDAFPKVVLRMDYLDDDMTFYILKHKMAPIYI